MSNPDPQHPAEPPNDGPKSGRAEDPATEQTPAPPPGHHYDPTMPQAYDPQAGQFDPQTGQYRPQAAQPYGPQPGQAYDPQTGMPLGPPLGPQSTGAYNAPYGPPPGYGPPGYSGYPPPGYGAYPPARPTNGMAIASLILGILWIYWVGSVLALIFGYIARQQIAERRESGDGMALAGIILGWIGVGVLALGMLVLFVGALASAV